MDSISNIMSDLNEIINILAKCNPKDAMEGNDTTWQTVHIIHNPSKSKKLVFQVVRMTGYMIQNLTKKGYEIECIRAHLGYLRFSILEEDKQ